MCMFVFEISGLTALQNQLPSLGTGTWSFISLWSENWHYCDLHCESNNIQHAVLYRQDWLLEWGDSMLPLREQLFFFFFNLPHVVGEKSFQTLHEPHGLKQLISAAPYIFQTVSPVQFSTRLLQSKRCNKSPYMQWRIKHIPHMHQEAPLHARFPWRTRVARAQENQHSTQHASFQSGSCLPVRKVWLLFSWWITMEHNRSLQVQQKGRLHAVCCSVEGHRWDWASHSWQLPQAHASSPGLCSVPCCSAGLHGSHQLCWVPGSWHMGALWLCLRRQNRLSLWNTFKNQKDSGAQNHMDNFKIPNKEESETSEDLSETPRLIQVL